MLQPFTSGQLTSFFKNTPHIGLSSAQRTRIAQEGLSVIEDFADFKEDQIEQVIENMRVSIPGVTAQLILARCMLWLKVASIVYYHHNLIKRAIMLHNMHYMRVLRNFHQEWEALMSLTEEDKPDVLTLSKNITPIKWSESFKDRLSHTFGMQKATLSCIIREN